MNRRLEKGLGKRSFRSILLIMLCVFSIVPLLSLTYVTYRRIDRETQRNIDSLIDNNMAMASQNLDVELSAYEDILFQLYTSEDVVKLAKNIDADVETALNRNQLIRTLRATCYYKPYIQGVTVFLPGGEMVYYDKLTGKATEISWLSEYPFTSEEIYRNVSSDNQTHYLPTAFAGFINSKEEYVFHIAHRIINYRNIYEQCGVVVLSIDVQKLVDIVSYVSDRGLNGESFLLDAVNVVFASERKELLGKTLANPQQDCLALAGGHTQPEWAQYTCHNEQHDWTIIRVINLSEMRQSIAFTQLWFLVGVLITSVILLIAIVVITRHLTSSIQTVASAMEAAGRGNLEIRISIPDNAPKELHIITEDFNHMMSDLGQMMEEVRIANERQRRAELTAVEAQINPHFLYNTLDTINWMAIDRDQYEISNNISALGGILRYAIDRSNRAVTVQEELGWLEKYIYLQQTRLKNGFDYLLEADEACMDFSIHKLLLQPFVENSIMHGFEGVSHPCVLKLKLYAKENMLHILICDNGRGMTAEEIAANLQSQEDSSEEAGHIGIRNVLSRLQLYYGETAGIQIESAPEMGTTIHIQIPSGKGERS